MAKRGLSARSDGVHSFRRATRRRTYLRVSRIEPLEVKNPLAATFADFDSASSLFVLGRHAAGPPAEILPGGPTGKFLRLSSTGNPATQNSIAFARTNDGPSSLVVVDLDFNMTPRVGRADGMGIILANTVHYGASGVVPPANIFEEPLFVGSVGIGFDVFKSPEEVDPSDPSFNAFGIHNEVSVHFGDAIYRFDATPVIDLASGEWAHVQIVLRMSAASSDISISFDVANSGDTVTLLDRFPVPHVQPYESRLVIGARSGGLAVNADIDNVHAEFLAPDRSVISVAGNSHSVLESGPPRTLLLKRVGDLTSPAGVGVSTTAGTASAADFVPVNTNLTFLPGESTKTVTLSSVDDAASEIDETLFLTVASPTGNAVLGSPKSVAVRILDDESSQEAGRWSQRESLGIVAIDAQVLPTGKVLLWDRLGHSRLFDPATGAVELAAQSESNLFCSGHAFLPDGRLFVAGGHLHDGDPAHDFVGIPDANIYDPFTDTWTKIAPMSEGRWYPTVLTLPSGEILVVSGTIAPHQVNAVPEIWSPVTQSWRRLTSATDLGAYGVDLYPRMFVTPEGRVYKVGSDKETWFLDVTGTGSWQRGPDRVHPLATYASAVMYAPGKIMFAGGGDAGDGRDDNDASELVEVIDLNEPIPQWRAVQPMRHARRHHNATLLPDGRVLVTGGTSGIGFNNEANSVLPAEVWNPVTGQWMVLLAMEVTRGYHSIALLTPEGRVLVAGGGLGANATSFHHDSEVFSPDYLFGTARPRVDLSPRTVHYTERTMLLPSQDAALVSRVTLVRLPSVTHAFDQNQRFAELTFEPLAGSLRINLPGDPNVMPPGHYMLFALSADGTPSQAVMLQVVHQSVQFVAPVTTLAEGAGSGTINVTRRGAADGSLSVAISITGGTASPVIDFGAIVGNLQWQDGERGTKTVTLPIVNNQPAEVRETVQLALAVANGGAALGSVRRTTVTIVDDDSAATDSIGLYDPARGLFFLRNSNTSGPADRAAAYGPGGDRLLPVMGDWDGDGDDTLGLFDKINSVFFLRNQNSAGIGDLTVAYGPPGQAWVPLSGDWNQDGIDTIGLFDPSRGVFFLKNSNSGGIADVVVRYGPENSGWTPIVGDWDGNGTATVGLYDAVASRFYLRNTNTAGVADINFLFGAPSARSIPLVGDWNKDAIDTIALYNRRLGVAFLRNRNDAGVADVTFFYGPPNNQWFPLAGDWDAPIALGSAMMAAGASVEVSAPPVLAVLGPAAPQLEVLPNPARSDGASVGTHSPVGTPTMGTLAESNIAGRLPPSAKARDAVFVDLDVFEFDALDELLSLLTV